MYDSNALTRRLYNTVTIGGIVPIRTYLAGLVGISPIVYRLATGASKVPGLLFNPTFTSWIPANIMEQFTTGALFPGAVGAIVLNRERSKITGKGYNGLKDYVVPAVLSTLLWDGVIGTLGKLAGVEGFERAGLIPFDIGVAATISTAYAYVIDNPRKVANSIYRYLIE